ncbi:M23 family metallopeptidase [Jiella sp. MQZ9-1]|uniref:M23 family metallopeptidase n=1 Tax=Jiella flava TaxID=2816857 RepID=A0A939FXS9_9HYPH|nr:M23 family metallopeptidase [Jiella flava]MBO0662844.1 M23 family metallopeptidase [Jiella flava]MCD2471395.1 M23 family metallopeptidase [Jiella flava]
MPAKRLKSTFGSPAEPHTIIIAKGESVRYFTLCRTQLRLAVAGVLLGTMAVLALPVSYMAFDFDAPAKTTAHSESQEQYERRIATLRAELDRATSKQFLTQKMVESKVDVLLQQQEEIAARYEKLQPLFDRAKASGLLPRAIPVPSPKPDDEVGTDATPNAANAAVDADVEPSGVSDAPENGLVNGFAPSQAKPASDWLGKLRVDASPPSGGVPPDMAKDETGSADARLRQIGKALSLAELGQLSHVEVLASRARQRAVRISSALQAAGIEVPAADDSKGGVGGPFVLAARASAFDRSVAELGSALDELKRVSETARKAPLEEPLPASTISSGFGIRVDPFLGRRALHSGIDFAVPRGRPIQATAAGRVIHAGPAGGYGNMVEIDHGNGITTRYGHMSTISVTVGEEVSRNETIGAVGSTGRSTGPHLHYEIREDGRPIDPERFFRIGEKLKSLA